MSYDTDYPLPLAQQARALSDGDLREIAKIKLSKRDTTAERQRRLLVTVYAPHLNWTYRHLLALGFRDDVCKKVVRGFYKRVLTRFVTPYLGHRIMKMRSADLAAVNSEALAIARYNSFLDATAGLAPFSEPHDNSVAISPETITSRRILMLRDNFLYFMRDLRDRIVARRVDLVRRGILTGAIGVAQLTDISITGSDPHHGTQVVLILNFGGSKCVYKPRDTRVDELLVGTDATDDGSPSLAKLLNDHGIGGRAPAGIRGYKIPLYRYLSNEHYGFVEFLEVDQSHSSEKHLKRYGYLLGVYSGMAMTFGISDVHHGNIMVCQRTLSAAVDGGNGIRHCLPHLTDLEIAFNDDVLSRAGSDADGGGGGSFVDRFKGTGLQDAITKYEALDEDDQWSFAIAPNFLSLTCEFAMDATLSPTENLPTAARDLHSRAYFRRSFDDGLQDFYEALRNIGSGTLVTLLSKFSDYRVRFHAMSTQSQLQFMRNCLIEGGRYDTSKALTTDLREGRGAFSKTLREDWNVCDVAYYQKALDTGAVYHILRTGEDLTDSLGAGSGGDTLAKVRHHIEEILRNGAAFQGKLGELRRYITDARTALR